jgi:hypothetical protein
MGSHRRDQRAHSFEEIAAEGWKEDSMNKIETARQCLRLIGDIADRGAASSDPANVGYALQELRQVVVESAGAKDRVFEPVPGDEIVNLESLLTELQFDDDSLQDMCEKASSD